jgi:uncharacterized RDD family membrane protein YckC
MSEPPPYPPPDPRWAPPDAAQAYPYYAPPPVVPPGVELAGWGSRFAAYLIDVILWLVIGVAVAAAAGFAVYGLVGGEDADSAGAATAVIGYLLVWLFSFVFYEPLTMRREGARNGQTWAKQWLGIRVVREDGHPVTAGTAFLRDVLMQNFVIGLLGGFVYIPPILNGLWPLWDARNQTWHDKVAHTVVIRA